MTEQQVILRPTKMMRLKLTGFPFFLICCGLFEVYVGYRGGRLFFWLFGWVVLCLGGLILLLFLLAIIFNDSELRLTEESLTMNHIFTKKQLKWLDITSLAPAKLSSLQGVVYDTVRKNQLNSLLMKYRKKRLGAEGFIGNMYGLDNGQFYNLLNDYWERAKKADGDRQEGAGDEQ